MLMQTTSEQGDLANIPEEVVRRALTSNEEKWLYSDNNQLFSGLQTFGGFGNLTGSLVIQYDKTALYGVYSTVRLHLLEATVVIFLVTALVVFFVVRVGFRDIANLFKLIHSYSSGNRPLEENATKGAMSESFAKQIRQSEDMKAQVASELEQLQALANHGKSQTREKPEVVK